MKHQFLLSCVAVLMAGFAPTALAAPLDVYIKDHKKAPLLVSAQASDEVIQGAQNFIQTVSGRGLDFLRNETLSESRRKSEFRDLLSDSFDLRTIARFAMGRHWRSATEVQKKEYLNLFKDMVIETYSNRFSEYQGQDISILKARPEGKRDAIVHSEIVSNTGSPAVKVDWRVRYKNGEYRIVDVLVEGVSMSLTQRSEFSSIIQRGGGSVEALLEKLRTR